MIYSVIVLTFGIFLGQEYNLPSIKDLCLYTYNFLNERKRTSINKENSSTKENSNYNIFTYFR